MPYGSDKADASDSLQHTLLYCCFMPRDVLPQTAVAHGSACATTSNWRHVSRGLRLAARDSSLHL